jgi:hypothetical protein
VREYASRFLAVFIIFAPLLHPPASHQPSHVARVKASQLLYFVLFGGARVPARCASSALPQQNFIITTLGAHSSL